MSIIYLPRANMVISPSLSPPLPLSSLVLSDGGEYPSQSGGDTADQSVLFRGQS